MIVTSKLLTGFDAPILQVMYLDKPMKDHNLLQAICRTNRTFGQEKTHGLIVDYIGIFDDVAQALDFDEKAVQQVVIEHRRTAEGAARCRCRSASRSSPAWTARVGGYEGLMAAQQCLPNNDVRDKFAAEYSVLGTIWEALSPDPMLSPYETDYRWLTQVYESVKPPSGNGKLLWHALGAKTIELINENVHVESVRDDVETLVMDARGAGGDSRRRRPGEEGQGNRDQADRPPAQARSAIPKFTALGERLEKIKERHEQGFLTSLEFLKEMLELAKEVVEAEKEVDPVEERDRAKEALTELFNEAKSKNTHIIVERIVADIDDIVKKVRFPDWQHTSQGERLVQKELRRTLLKYKLHTDQELFDKAYGYIRQYSDELAGDSPQIGFGPHVLDSGRQQTRPVNRRNRRDSQAENVGFGLNPGVDCAPAQSLFQTGETADAQNLRNVADNGRVRGGRCCQQNVRFELGRNSIGSPAWIRTTIHGSKGRCPTVRRPGKMQEARAPISVTQAPELVIGGNQSKSNRPTTQRTFSSFEDCACHRTGLAPTSIVAGSLLPLGLRRNACFGTVIQRNPLSDCL